MSEQMIPGINSFQPYSGIRTIEQTLIKSRHYFRPRICFKELRGKVSRILICENFHILFFSRVNFHLIVFR